MLKSVYNLTVLKTIKIVFESSYISFSGAQGICLFPRIFKVEFKNNELSFFPSVVNLSLVRRLYPHVNKATDHFLVSIFLTFYNQLLQRLRGCLVLYKVELRFIGIGYKIKKYSKKLNLLQMDLGLSHLSLLAVPSSIYINLISNTRLIVRCKDKQVLFQFIRSLKQKAWPNIYTGKGIVVKGEKLRKKAIVK